MHRGLIATAATALALAGAAVLPAPAQAVVDGEIITDVNKYPYIGYVRGYEQRPSFGGPVKSYVRTDCGATLIAPDAAVTAVHCLDHKTTELIKSKQFTAGQLKVTFGETKRSSSSGQTVGVKEIWRPSPVAPYDDVNDYMVLRLVKTITGITPATVLGQCQTVPAGTKLFSAGWGTGGDFGTQMQRQTGHLMTSPDSYAKYFFTTNDTGRLKDGDSGNGLFYTPPTGQPLLMGVLHRFYTVTDNGTALNGFERVDASSPQFASTLYNGSAQATFRSFLTRQPAGCPSVPTPRPIPNKAPVASFTYSRQSGAGNVVQLNGTGSSDPDGKIATWRWTSGGTFLDTGATPTVKLGAVTSAQVTLTVTDNVGATAQVTRTLALPNRAPVIGSLSPRSGTVVGSNTPTLSAQASDADTDALQYSYRVTGPSVDVSSGWVSGAWQVPAHRLDPGTIYQWTATVRDGKTSVSASGSFTVAMLPTAADVVSTPSGNGYWQVDTYGGVFSYGDAQFYGSLPGLKVNVTNILGMARTPTGGGYWLVGRDGGVFAFGDAQFYGSLPGLKIKVGNIVGMAATKTGNGYWLVGSDGGVFAFGDAQFYGSMGGKPLNAPVEGIAVSPTGGGYWLAAKDGGIFAFGDAPFYGSMGGKPLNAPIVDIDATPDGRGYWMTAEDGGVFAFGNAGFYGSMAGKPLNGHITGMSVTPTGAGYWLTGCDGGVFAFGNAVFRGSKPTFQCRGIG